ncbi:MAG: hypothetical protein M5U22_02825 [Thermoleophilia bacterium]|nr:hypothetical protein [Thermoleophilia bacterium]
MRGCIIVHMSEWSPYDSCHDSAKDDRVECRACGVVCERVIHPVHCLRSECRYVYAFEEGSVTYFGCVEKVFGAELDLAAYRGAPTRDVYGALKARKTPLPECGVQIEKAYAYKYTWHACHNPIFLQSPASWAPDAVRRLVEGCGNDAAA